MSFMRWNRGRSRGASVKSRYAVAVAVAVTAFCVMASSAFAARVNIVSQGAPPEVIPAHVFYYKTIQAAVNAAKTGGWVLVEPGVYHEEVKITPEHNGLTLRGMNRNTVLIDGQGKKGNGIEVQKANNIWIENLTVANFEGGCSNCGNEIWWNGGAGSGKIGAHGWYGEYLTAYDTGMDGEYGIFTNNEAVGEWNHIYASGFADSGMYLGACPECRAVINHATMENNALGYSGSNSGGNLIIENSVFRNNSVGIAPNSENPGDGPPPQNGACEASLHKHPLPVINSTEIARCTIIRNNLVEANGNLTTPATTSRAPWGAGIELPGVYADLIEGNTIKNNPSDGVLGFEYPNPFPIAANTIYFQLSGNKIANNTFSGNGSVGYGFAGDVALSGGLFGTKTSTNNCLSGNTFGDAVYPENIEGTWGCQHKTTPNPELGVPGIEYLLSLQAESEGRTAVPQPAPPAQETMPDPCEGVPVKNALCP
jgi:Protein of unknown function (DUF1565)